MSCQPPLKIYTKRKRWLTTTTFFPVTCYNVTMLNNKYYTEFFELGQQKMNFSFFELHLPDDNPVYTLKYHAVCNPGDGQYGPSVGFRDC